MPTPVLPRLTALAFAASLTGCLHHDAPVRGSLWPAPSATPVQHSGRLWVQLGEGTWEHQCRKPPGQRELCFSGVRRATLAGLERSLWSSFPEIRLREGDVVPAGDYLLELEVSVDALPPQEGERAGWSTLATGGFQLSRDGEVLRHERLGSRSRADFAYGRALGVAAGEVVDALAAHVGLVLGAVPEPRPLPPVPLPKVVVEVVAPSEPSAQPFVPTSPLPVAPAPGGSPGAVPAATSDDPVAAR